MPNLIKAFGISIREVLEQGLITTLQKNIAPLTPEAVEKKKNLILNGETSTYAHNFEAAFVPTPAPKFELDLVTCFQRMGYGMGKIML